MKWTTLIRTHDWWNWKLAPLFALGYATALQTGMDLLQLLPQLLLVVLSIVVGAAYVSLINDYTDMPEDLACGKHNRLSRFSKRQQHLLLMATVIPGILFFIVLYRDALSVFFYLMAWVAFSMYSLPPFRLKARGAWGLLADASGAHLFPTLTVVAAVYSFSHQLPSATWMLATGAWAFTYGLRGILWHQFLDRENDLGAGLNTFAVKWTPQQFRPIAIAVFCTEVVALSLLLFYLQQPLVWQVLVVYIVGVAAAKSVFGLPVVAVLPKKGKHYILLSTFYQFLFPVALLASVALQQPAVWWLVVLHLVLFPKNLLAGFANAIRLAKRVATGKVAS